MERDKLYVALLGAVVIRESVHFFCASRQYWRSSRWD
jgi:hypothetical protein